MALEGDIKLNDQLDVKSAYFKVDGVTGGKRGYTAHVDVYATREAAHQGLTPLRSFSFSFSYVEGRDPIALAYLVAPTVEGTGDLRPVLEEGQAPGELPEQLKPKAETPAESEAVEQ